MECAGMAGTDVLADLLRHPHLWRAREGMVAPHGSVPTGSPVLDQRLPGGGWPLGGVTELLYAREGTGELSLLLPALGALTGSRRHVVFVNPPYLPYAPALAAGGVALERVLVVRVAPEREALWAAEQILRDRGCGAMLGWFARTDARVLRRLQLAAETGGAWGVLFRSPDQARVPSPASLRLHLEAGPEGCAVRILKCRGFPPSGRIPLPNGLA